MSTLTKGCFRPSDEEVGEVNREIAEEGEPPVSADEMEAARISDEVTCGNIPAASWRELCSNESVVRQAENGMKARLAVTLILKGELALRQRSVQ